MHIDGGGGINRQIVRDGGVMKHHGVEVIGQSPAVWITDQEAPHIRTTQRQFESFYFALLVFVRKGNPNIYMPLMWYFVFLSKPSQSTSTKRKTVK